MFTDPVLLAELRSMGAVRAKTSGGVSLATCGAVASAITRHIPQLQNVADAVRELAGRDCPSLGGIVDERHLSAGQAREARLPCDLRREGDASSYPPSAANDPIPGGMLDIMKRRVFARHRMSAKEGVSRSNIQDAGDDVLPPPSPMTPCGQQHPVPQPDPNPSEEAGHPPCNTSAAREQVGTDLPQCEPLQKPSLPILTTPCQPLNPPKRDACEAIPNDACGVSNIHHTTTTVTPGVGDGSSPSPHTPSPTPAAVPAGTSTGVTAVGLGLSRQQQAWYYKVGSKMPSSLPNLAWDASSLDKRGRFGLFYLLKPLPDSIPAKREVPALEKWCCRLYNFNDRGTTGVSKSTWQGIHSTVSKFLGFAYVYEKVPMPLLSLRLFSNPVSRSQWIIWVLVTKRCIP